MTFPQVKEASVSKVFPGKVIIKVKEWPRVALLLQDSDHGTSELRPVLENGVVLDEPWTGGVDKPLLRGWDDTAAIMDISKELAKVNPDALSTLSEIQPGSHDTYEDEVRVFTDEGNEVITRIATFHRNINQYRNFVDPERPGIVHMTYSEDFGWFEPYVQKTSKDDG